MTGAVRADRVRPPGGAPTLHATIDGAEAAGRKAARGAGAGRLP